MISYRLKVGLGISVIIGNYAKAARGLMVNYIVKNKINSVQGVKQFNVNNYRFDEVNSTTSELKFIRKN